MVSKHQENKVSSTAPQDFPNHWFSLRFWSNWATKYWKTIGFHYFCKHVEAEVLGNPRFSLCFWSNWVPKCWKPLFFAMFLLISWCVARLDFQMSFAKTVFFAMVSLISHAPARLDVETAIFKTQDFAMLCACTGLFRQCELWRPHYVSNVI